MARIPLSYAELLPQVKAALRKNPTPSQAAKLARELQSQGKSTNLRFVEDENGDVYTWPAELADHHIVESLGIIPKNWGTALGMTRAEDIATRRVRIGRITPLDLLDD